MDKKSEKRCEELFALDMVYNGTEYIGKKDLNKDFNVHWVEITCDPDNVWDEKISKLKAELEKRKALNRPVIDHKHTKGNWGTEFVGSPGCNYYYKVTVKNGESICNITTRNEERAHANAKIIEIAPALLQIAEMYFDYMKSNEMENTLMFEITLNTLNKLK